MAKDNRIIHGAVRVSGKGVFKAGQEDELAEALSAAEVQNLTDKGVISGFGKVAEQKTAEETPEKPADEQPKQKK